LRSGEPLPAATTLTTSMNATPRRRYVLMVVRVAGVNALLLLGAVAVTILVLAGSREPLATVARG
jgi:hypothetical protein